MDIGLDAADGVALVLALLVSVVWQVFVVVLGVVIAWRWLHRPGGWAAHARSRDKTAFEILDERYARGEIDAAEYEERRARLIGDRAR